MKLEVDDAAKAYITWAQAQISSVSSDRLEVAKFFFSVSGASLAFFVALWQAMHTDKLPLKNNELISIVMLCVSILWSMVIFWPISHDFSKVDLQKEHSRILHRIKIEGAIWAILWIAGAACSIYSTFKK